MNQKKKLLPIGFRDVLTNDANLQFEYGKKLLNNFNKWGYSFIEPPIIEYEKTLTDEKNKLLNKKTLSFLDPLTKEKISLRHDITTQLARIAEDRLFGLPKPLRLCYFGDVFRADKPKLSSDRQFKQAGVEIIGSKDLLADIEIIGLSLDSLKKINFKKISIDVNVPIILEKIFDDFKIALNKRIFFKKLVAKKNIKEIYNYNIELYTILKKIIDSSGPLKKNLKKIKKIKFGKNANKIIKDFIEVCSLLANKNYDKYKISLDLLDHRGFEYYTGITFSIFCLNSNKEVCRGGRYLTSNKKDAVGSTFLLNQFLQLKKISKNNKKKILISYNSAFDKSLDNLRKKGWVTIQNISQNSDKKIAKLHGCKFILKNNKVRPLK
ncbi:MAG: ATP phosphoribosyltransferase regulatory subunit [Alphaproteobacteria bacterium MarineAlpha6_Bin4]|nr:MAG: ATP phosphoribosyltransferase regulatory subunit [Alphaproteobacteria bacterium MarineAlpha6_Bin3]PPR37607.1 MAG: ATP phosphoribosyltransferase regulatory subunit [Alphaproteobacteria bacterium MarineAlpha6_Bin4]|tara:strand:- start:21177 stop:22316 length:1140 start_codon:yes stop_codon:yes gene_type:complete